MSQQLASIEDVEQLAREWTDSVLLCRTKGHRWEGSQVHHNREYRYYRIVELCERCQSSRFTEMSETGKNLGKWYEYSEGYLSKGVGRIVGTARDSLRLSAVLRTYNVRNLTSRQALKARPTTKAARQELGIAS